MEAEAEEGRGAVQRPPAAVVEAARGGARGVEASPRSRGLSIEALIRGVASTIRGMAATGEA